jgi:hypothetical protein
MSQKDPIGNAHCARRDTANELLQEIAMAASVRWGLKEAAN